MFAHPQTGGPLDHKRYAGTFRAALATASVEGEVCPFHDGRHTSITNAAAAGVGPGALQARAGHSDLSTTQRYIDLAGVCSVTRPTSPRPACSGSSRPSRTMGSTNG